MLRNFMSNWANVNFSTELVLLVFEVFIFTIAATELKGMNFEVLYWIVATFTVENLGGLDGGVSRQLPRDDI
jgi:hypothetical protein